MIILLSRYTNHIGHIKPRSLLMDSQSLRSPLLDSQISQISPLGLSDLSDLPSWTPRSLRSPLLDSQISQISPLGLSDLSCWTLRSLLLDSQISHVHWSANKRWPNGFPFNLLLMRRKETVVGGFLLHCSLYTTDDMIHLVNEMKISHPDISIELINPCFLLKTLMQVR